MANNLGVKMSSQLFGANALRAALQQLPNELQSKTLGNATAKGARHMLSEVRAETKRKFTAGYSVGLIEKALRSTRGVKRNTESSAFVGIRPLSRRAVARFKRETGKKSGLNPVDPYYWKVLEFGKSDRTAHPFLRPAFNASKERSADVIFKAIKAGLATAIRKLRIPPGAK